MRAAMLSQPNSEDNASKAVPETPLHKEENDATAADCYLELEDASEVSNVETFGQREEVIVDEATTSTSTTDALDQTESLPSSTTSPTSPPPPPDLTMGDHVYQWCSWAGLPAVYARHAIVLRVLPRPTDDASWKLLIAEFWNPRQKVAEDNVPPQNACTDVTNDTFFDEDDNQSDINNNHTDNNTNHNPPPRIRVYETDPQRWHKVTYEAGFWRQHLQRGGTATAVRSDPPAVVRARVQFLIRHDDNPTKPSLLPPYQAVRANAECVAVWCKTGTWATLQAASWLTTLSAGQVKSTATLAGAALTTTVTQPAAGFWGWMGYTTTTPLLTAQPWLGPALVAYGVVTVGGPALWLAWARRHWRHWTTTLNEAFWQDALDHPEDFAEAMMYWSGGSSSSSGEEMATTPVTMRSHSGLLENIDAAPAEAVASSETKPDQISEPQGASQKSTEN